MGAVGDYFQAVCQTCECSGWCITPKLIRFETQFFSSVRRLRWLPIGARQEQEAKGPGPNRTSEGSHLSTLHKSATLQSLFS